MSAPPSLAMPPSATVPTAVRNPTAYADPLTADGYVDAELVLSERPRVLVIDDDPDTRLMLRSVLEEDGFDVYGRHDGVSALSAALTLRPHVVVLDWMLPSCSGLEVCSALRSRRQLDGTAILMITARRREGDLVLCHGAGADRFLLKPIVPRMLAEHVRELVTPGFMLD
jgi:two-component system phosphate regulon response regulator PhoB